MDLLDLVTENGVSNPVAVFPSTLPCSGGSKISPRRGRQLSGGGHQHKILPKFPKNCMKLKEFGPRGKGGGARPKFYYVDPPLPWTLFILNPKNLDMTAK